MTTGRSPLPDAVLRDVLRDLAAGPEASTLVADVMRSVPGARQVRPAPWVALPRQRRIALLGLAALLGVGLLGAALAGGAFDPPLSPPLTNARPPALVIQTSNGLRDPAYVVTHTAYAAGSTVGTRLTGLPPNAVGLRWSSDATRLAYFVEVAPPGREALSLTGLFLAEPDGSNPRPVTLPRPMDQYASNGFWAGVRWAPSGGRFLLSWSTYTCTTGDVNCIPPGGIDVFDAAGQLIASIATPDNVGQEAWWSPDSRAVAWESGHCPTNACSNDALHWRSVEGDPTETTIPIEGVGALVWARDGFHVVAVGNSGDTHVKILALDGTNAHAIPWTTRQNEWSLGWSPDGRWLAAADAAGRVRIHEIGSGKDVVVAVPKNLGIAGWSPLIDRLVLFGADDTKAAGYGFYVVNVDGTGAQSLGPGDDFGWLPQ